MINLCYVQLPILVKMLIKIVYLFILAKPHDLQDLITVPQPGTESRSLAVKALSPNHWPTWNSPEHLLVLQCSGTGDQQ